MHKKRVLFESVPTEFTLGMLSHLQSKQKRPFTINRPRPLRPNRKDGSFSKPLQCVESEIIKHDLSYSSFDGLHDRNPKTRIDRPERLVYNREHRSGVKMGELKG